jgi:hypothetical protein
MSISYFWIIRSSESQSGPELSLSRKSHNSRVRRTFPFLMITLMPLASARQMRGEGGTIGFASQVIVEVCRPIEWWSRISVLNRAHRVGHLGHLAFEFAMGRPAISVSDSCNGRPMLVRPSPDVPPASVVETRKSIHIQDVRADRGYLSAGPLPRAAIEVAGMRTPLVVPMLK